MDDLIKIIQEQYKNSEIASEKVTAEIDAAFYQGKTMVYYDVLDIIRSQLIAFGYDPEALGSFVPELNELATPNKSKVG